MKSVPSLLFFKPMKEEPEEHHWSTMDSYKMNLKIIQTSKGPYLRVSHTIKENPMEDGVQWIRLPYLVGEKCLNKSTGEVVTIVSCEPMRVSEICVADLQELGYFASLMQDPCDMADQIKDKFKADWRKRHPGKEWAWRVEGEEVTR